MKYLLSSLGFSLLIVLPTLAAGADSTKGKSPLTLTEDLRLSPEKGEHYRWESIRTMVSTDAKGNLYVMDQKTGEIKVYDSKGSYLKTVGKRGKADGEFENPFSFHVTDDGKIVVLDLVEYAFGVLHYFDENHQFVNKIKQKGIPFLLQNAVFAPDGKTFAASVVRPNHSIHIISFETGVYNQDFELIQTFSYKLDHATRREDFNKELYWEKRLRDNFDRFHEGTGVFNIDSKGNVYSAKSHKYEITRWNSDGKTANQTYTRTYEPIRFSKDDKSNYLEMGKKQLVEEEPDVVELVSLEKVVKGFAMGRLPDFKNPVFGIIPMEDGSIIAVHDFNTETRTNLGDVFAADGKYLGEIKVENNALMRFTSGAYLTKMIFRNGFAYAVTNDAQNNNHVVRFKYQLKP